MGKNMNDQANTPVVDESVNTDDKNIADVNEATAAANAPVPKTQEAPTPEMAAATAENLVEVKAIKPFFDLQAEVDRNVGDKFSVTEARADELRQVGVVK